VNLTESNIEFRETACSPQPALDSHRVRSRRLDAVVSLPDLRTEKSSGQLSCGMLADSSLGGWLRAFQPSAGERSSHQCLRFGLGNRVSGFIAWKDTGSTGQPGRPGAARPAVYPLQRRSGCVPALPYPPLEQNQDKLKKQKTQKMKQT